MRSERGNRNARCALVWCRHLQRLLLVGLDSAGNRLSLIARDQHVLPAVHCHFPYRHDHLIGRSRRGVRLSRRPGRRFCSDEKKKLLPAMFGKVANSESIPPDQARELIKKLREERTRLLKANRRCEIIADHDRSRWRCPVATAPAGQVVQHWEQYRACYGADAPGIAFATMRYEGARGVQVVWMAPNPARWSRKWSRSA